MWTRNASSASVSVNWKRLDQGSVSNIRALPFLPLPERERGKTAKFLEVRWFLKWHFEHDWNSQFSVGANYPWANKPMDRCDSIWYMIIMTTFSACKLTFTSENQHLNPCVHGTLMLDRFEWLLWQAKKRAEEEAKKKLEELLASFSMCLLRSQEIETPGAWMHNWALRSPDVRYSTQDTRGHSRTLKCPRVSSGVPSQSFFLSLSVLECPESKFFGSQVSSSVLKCPSHNSYQFFVLKCHSHNPFGKS